MCDIQNKDLSLSFLAPSGGNSFTHPRPSSLAHRSVGWIWHRPQAVLTRIKHPPDHLLFTSPRCPRTGTAGKSSEACHLEDDSHPQPAHPDTSGAATGLRGHGAVLSFSLWKQTPAEIEGAELAGGTALLSLKKPGERWNCSNLSPYFAPVPRGGRRSHRANTLKTESICHRGHQVATRGTSHLSVPRKGRLTLFAVTKLLSR